MLFRRRIPLIATAISILALSFLPAFAGGGGFAVRHSAYPPDEILQELLDGAERVFLGRCISLEEGTAYGDGASTVTVTFQVERMLAGPESEEISFLYYSRLPGGSDPTAGEARFSREETAAYGNIETAVGRDAVRIERMNMAGSRAKSGATGHDRAPVRFHLGEEVLLFLPRLTQEGYLRTNAPGFAKMTITPVGPEEGSAAIASAGPNRLTDLPFSPGRHGSMEDLIRRIETEGRR